jgi:hypothetical protein
MPMRCGAVTVVALLAIGSTSMIPAAGGDFSTVADKSSGNLGQLPPDMPGTRDALAAISVPPRALIGHRQPRAEEVPVGQQLSPLELELRREDEEIDKKIIICRRC